MPGGPAHLLHGFGMALLLSKATNGRFAPPHAVIYGISNYLGPDLGTWGGWFKDNFTALPGIVSSAMDYLHHPVGFVCIFSLPLAVLFNRFPWHMFALDHCPKPSATGCWFLIVAGGLSHFFLETLFEENGQTDLYRTILGTGAFEEPNVNDIPLWVIIVVGMFCLAIPGVYIHAFGFAEGKNSFESQWRRAASGLSQWTALFVTYFALCRYGLDVAPVGEEADLGVIMFMILFIFSPLWLCLRSIE